MNNNLTFFGPVRFTFRCNRFSPVTPTADACIVVIFQICFMNCLFFCRGVVSKTHNISVLKVLEEERVQF